MNKYIIILGLLVANSVIAQVAIEKTSLRSPNGSILEFNDMVEANGVEKGIILPIVQTIDPSTTEGTMYYDANTDKVVYVSATQTVDMTSASTSNVAIPNLSDIGEGTVIRDGSISFTADTAPAVLKLSSNHRALLLPHVNSTDDVPTPEPGTIVYEDNSNSLAIFNGTNWAFWN